MQVEVEDAAADRAISWKVMNIVGVTNFQESIDNV